MDIFVNVKFYPGIFLGYSILDQHSDLPIATSARTHLTSFF